MKVWKLACLGLIGALLCAAPFRAAAQEPEAPDTPIPAPQQPQARELDARLDPRLAARLSLEVRAAGIGETLSSLEAALGVPLSAAPGVGAQRITLYAGDTSLFSIQQALASLLHTRWQPRGEGEQIAYRLLEDTASQARADALRRQRRSLLLNSLLRTAVALQRRPAEAVALELRQEVAARMPELPEEALESITPELLQQTWLLAPVQYGLSQALLRDGGVWVPFQQLSPAHRVLFATFSSGAAGADLAPYYPEEVLTSPLSPLAQPQARLEYRYLYGDRWAGSLLAIRAGLPNRWAATVLPSALYPIPDYASLYPEAQVRPGDPALQNGVNVTIDTEALSWDQAITLLAERAGLNVLSDSYPRPDVFRTPGTAPVIVGTTVGATLDRLASHYGYVWWRLGDFYVFRHRYWAEEQRVAVPEELLQWVGAGVSGGRLATDRITGLAHLTDEQLLTLNSYGRAAGRGVAPPEAFDLDQMQLAQRALSLFSGLTPAQKELARSTGISALQLDPSQRQALLAIAYERALPVALTTLEQWRFRVSDAFRRERLSAGWAELGTVRFLFDYGNAGAASAELAVRAPAVEAPAATDAAPAGSPPAPIEEGQGGER
ncbi:MAG: hypothetical protein ACK47B_02000 [Armatimonadota bacterium]